MAFGGAATTAMASKFAARIINPIRLSSSHLPNLSLHRTPMLQLHPQPFSPFQINQRGLKYQIRAISEAVVDPVSSNKENGERSPQSWKIKMLYDGDCPLCMREVMGRIHAILADGTVVRDVEAFRRLYEQVNLGWVYAVTKYEPFGTLADVAYGIWARYRLQLTGRPPLEDILVARKKNQDEACNDSNTCKR